MANGNEHEHVHHGHDHTTGMAMAPEVGMPSTGAAESTAPEKKNLTGTIYTCPMHPQIRRDQPGNCPICGMTLEPAALTQLRPRPHWTVVG